ncbi:MAG: PIG-L family deacetylase [Pseudomonadota bacterium]
MTSFSLALGLALAMAPPRATVYVAAHQDDIVLLMGRSVQTDIKADLPTVLIVMTAGDAGNGSSPASAMGIRGHQYNQMGNPYFRVRHNAQEAAITYWLPARHARAPRRSTESFGDRLPRVEKVEIGNVVLYYLNLPDGQLDAFHTGAQATMADIEGVNVYTQESLRNTLREIIRRNHRSVVGVMVHTPDPTPDFRAPDYNENGMVHALSDHPDHVAAGRFMRDAIASSAELACVDLSLYMGYWIRTLPDSMTYGEKQSQVSAFTILDTVLKNQGNIASRDAQLRERLGSMDAFHTSFYGKQKWRPLLATGERCTVVTTVVRHAR